jgi:hypothetical protein
MSTATTHDQDVQWLEANLSRGGAPVVLTDDQQRCVAVLASVWALHNLHMPAPHKESIRLHSRGLSVLIHSNLATYDGDHLTRLVIAAHQHRVRVQISPWLPWIDVERAQAVRAHILTELVEDFDLVNTNEVGFPSVLEVGLWARSSTGHMFERHPGITDLVGLLADREDSP